MLYSAPLQPVAASAFASSNTSLITNYDSFTITSSNGQYVSVVNGASAAGALEIGPAEPLNEIGAELELRFYVPDPLPGEAYTVTPAGSSAGAEYKTSMFYDQPQFGFYTRIVAERSGNFVFGADGGVHAQLSAPSRITVSATLNDADRDLYTVTVSGTDSMIGIMQASEGVMTAVSYTASVGITVSGDHESDSVVFTDIDASKGISLILDNEPDDLIPAFPIVGAAATAKDFISIVETAANSRVWALSFKVTETYANGEKMIVTRSININASNANVSGRYNLGEYTLIYDIKGNGSNIKEFRVVLN